MTLISKLSVKKMNELYNVCLQIWFVFNIPNKYNNSIIIPNFTVCNSMNERGDRVGVSRGFGIMRDCLFSPDL